MVRLHTGIIALCLLSAFTSPAYTQTPDLAAYHDLFRNRVDCGLRDAECIIKQTQRFYYFVKTYPTSNSAREVAEFAAMGYERANEVLRQKGRFSEAVQYETLAQEMRKLATAAPQQTASPQPTARPAEPSKPVPQTVAPPQPAPPPPQSNEFIPIKPLVAKV